MAKIAILDDAINGNLLETPVVSRYTYFNGHYCKADLSNLVTYTHGTIVAKILETYACDFEIVSIQLLDNWFTQRRCPTKLLTLALKLCTELDIDIVHISLGSVRLSEIRDMNSWLERITQSGIPIIAACSNDLYRTIPASCHNVFGVVCDTKGNLQEGQYAVEFNPYLGTNFIANNILTIPNKFCFSKCNSLAAPVITAQVNNLINRGTKRTIPDLMNKLQQNANYISVDECTVDNRSMHPIGIPIIWLTDIFSQDSTKQLELLNMFADDGFEAFGLSDAIATSDVRLINFNDVCRQSISKILSCMDTYTKSDLLIVFLDKKRERLLQVENTTGIDHLLISQADFSIHNNLTAQEVYLKLRQIL